MEVENYFEISPVIEHMASLEELSLKGAGGVCILFFYWLNFKEINFLFDDINVVLL